MSEKTGAGSAIKEDDKRSASVKSSSTHGAKTHGHFFSAVAAGDISAVKAAIKGGTSVSEVDGIGWTPLRKAARAGNLDMVTLLLECNADITQGESQELLTATSWGRTDVLTLLIESKAQVADVAWEVSPLVIAAQNGHLSCIKILVEAQADLNTVDANGNDSLMTAWDCGRSAIVCYLVENGATLKRKEDWERLSQSPSTALNIASGSALNIQRMLKQVEMGEMTAADMPKRTVPEPALCAWIRVVPSAALILLDQVLMKTPLEAPVRATLKNNLINTAYLSIDDWFPKEEPELLTLAPRDTGSGTKVATHVMQHQGILTTDVFYALTVAERMVFDSIVIGAMLEHSWKGLIDFRYRMEVFLEFLTVASLVLVSVGDIVEPSIVFSSISVVCDIAEDMRQLSYHRAKNERFFINFFSSTGASFFRYFRIAITLIYIFVYAEEASRKGRVLDEFSSFKAPLSFVAFTRWTKLMLHLPAYAVFGPKMLPIIRSLQNTSHWVIVAFIMLLGASHATGVLALEHSYVTKIFLSRYQLFVTQRFDAEIFFSRRHHYAEYSTFNPSFPELTDHTLALIQELWFLIVAFVCGVVLLNILIAVISDGYDIEKERGYVSFLQMRTHVTFNYLLTIENKRSSPFELAYQNIFKSGRLDGSKYLWWCSVINEETNEYKMKEKYARCGRLGKLVEFTEDAVKSEHKKLCARLENFEDELQKKIQAFNSELKNVKKDVIAILDEE